MTGSRRPRDDAGGNFFFFILFPRLASVDARAFDRVKCDASLYKMTRVLTRL